MMYAYGIVILPPPGLHRELMLLRKKHALLRSVSPPHITVKAPFVPRGTLALVTDRLEEISSRIEPFEIRVNGLGTFGSKVIYVRVEKSPELRRLHSLLLEGLEEYIECISDKYEGQNYTPHLTVAEKLATEDFEPAWAAMARFRPRLRFMVEHLHILRGQGRWDIARSIRLGT